MHKITPLLLTSALAFICLPSHAEYIEPFSCRNGYFPSEGKFTQLYTVVGKHQTHFFKDTEGCPESEGCMQKAYVIEGDEVLVNKIEGDWACAWYQGKKRETVGWIVLENLAPAADPVPQPNDWLGTWKTPASSITIEQQEQGNGLHVAGDAIWGIGASAHVGEIDGTLKPEGRYAMTKEGDGKYDCAVEFSRVGRFLIVDDNNNCGGMNVSFDGVYVRE